MFLIILVLFFTVAIWFREGYWRLMLGFLNWRRGASLLFGFCFWMDCLGGFLFLNNLCFGTRFGNFRIGAMAILYSIMCYGVEIINFLELNSLPTLDRLLINLFTFGKAVWYSFQWVFGFTEFWWFLWVLSLGIFILVWGFVFIVCLRLMISNVTISLLLGFADCASSSQIWQMNLCKKCSN